MELFQSLALSLDVTIARPGVISDGAMAKLDFGGCGSRSLPWSLGSRRLETSARSSELKIFRFSLQNSEEVILFVVNFFLSLLNQDDTTVLGF